MQSVCDVLEDLLACGAIQKYAIGGATAAGFHGEPLATRDIDVFCYLDAPTDSIHYADIAVHFNGMKNVFPELLGVVVRLVSYCDTKLSIAPEKVFFESDWQNIKNCYGR